MKILFISYGLWEFDGRLRELVKSMLEIGEVTIVSRSKKKNVTRDYNHVKIVNKSFVFFIFKCIIESFRFSSIDVLFIDNRKAIIPSLIILMFNKPKKIILDVRELYLSNESVNIISKVGCYIEGKMIKKADVVISANKYRSMYMKKYYCLKNFPLVYENIRKLEWTSNSVISNFKDKYKKILEKNTFKIISTSGWSISRKNDVLVKAMVLLGCGYDLILVGGGSKKDFEIIKDIIDKNKLSNVYLVDSVEEDELKFLIINSDIGIVNYNQDDSNNRYCASGKIYEFVYEEKPVVTTENVPLIDICNKYGIGVADNNYVNGILKVKSEYSFFKNNVLQFLKKIDVEDNNKKLVKLIKYRLFG